MKLDRDFKKLPRALALGAALALISNSSVTAPKAQEKIFETNVTSDLNLSSGEPEIAVDPTNPRHLAIIEFAMGSAKAPAASYNPVTETDVEKTVAASLPTGRVMLSKDGGNHWAQSGPPPASDPAVAPVHGGGDPMIAIGPDGTIYAADEPAPKMDTKSIGSRDFSNFTFMIAASTNGGKTFGAPQVVGTPLDRPWLKVDQSTGTVYTVSSGAYNPTTKQRNVPGPDAPNDRWLVAWQPHLAGKSEPRRLGGPDFSGSGGSTISAAHGVIAATFVLGGPTPGGGFTGGPPPPVPVPASLQAVINDGTSSCSMQAPCLFFETSSDQGQHWTRHHVPVAGGFSGQRAQVSADPGRAGRYAIGILSSTRTNLLVLITDDSGASWSGPVTVPEAAPGVDFKQWMEYGPSGVLGLMWKKERSDLTPPGQPSGFQMPGRAVGPAFDVYAAISCDGGTTWLAPARVNSETSPAGPTGLDDLSYIALDAKYAHLVWGDRRALPQVHATTPTSMAGVQVYYGRVPFSTVSSGADCGRR
jgi:hypothetical protein